MPFQPGQSGNPTGARPERVTRVRVLAREQTEKAINALIAALDDDSARVRVAAAEALLDRGWGRAPQAITGADDGPVAIVCRWLTTPPTQS